jgi:heat shock protein HslJ
MSNSTCLFWLPVLLFFAAACQSGSTSQSELSREPVATNNAARMQADLKKLQEGVDFKAQGNEPFWSVEIDFDKVMQFKSLNHPQELSTPVPAPAQMQDAPGERYRAVTEAGELIVTILKDSCSDSMSGEQFPYKVRVDAKLTTDADYAHYEGCGRYLTDYRLHNIWVVEEMQGEPLKAEDFAKGLPTLEFFPGEGQVGGHDGCNRIFGKIETQGNQLTFGIIGATRMACPNMEKSDRFNQLLNEQTFTYAFEPRQLLLKQGEEVVLRLKNVD